MINIYTPAVSGAGEKFVTKICDKKTNSNLKTRWRGNKLTIEYEIQEKEFSSVIRRPNRSVNSYVVTIPIAIIDTFNLKEQDKIVWKYVNNGDKVLLDIDVERQTNKQDI